jgi:hypothetical protein
LSYTLFHHKSAQKGAKSSNSMLVTSSQPFV